MVEQHEVDRLLQALETLQQQVQQDRQAVNKHLPPLLERAEQLREASIGGKFEPAMVSVHELLTSYRDSVRAQQRLQRLAA